MRRWFHAAVDADALHVGVRDHRCPRLGEAVTGYVLMLAISETPDDTVRWRIRVPCQPPCCDFMPGLIGAASRTFGTIPP